MVSAQMNRAWMHHVKQIAAVVKWNASRLGIKIFFLAGATSYAFIALVSAIFRAIPNRKRSLTIKSLATDCAACANAGWVVTSSTA